MMEMALFVGTTMPVAVDVVAVEVDVVFVDAIDCLAQMPFRQL